MRPLPGAYSFLPYARQGLGVHIHEGDQDSTIRVRGSIDVRLRVTGQKIAGGTDGADVPRPVQLYGPGEILGIDTKAIVRTEPRHWITNFEPNYFPFVEFYDEDFPWRYTPAKPSPDKRRLRPWLTLVVLQERAEGQSDAQAEFTDHPDLRGRPLPSITVPNAAGLFSSQDDLWAWAHVHVNGAFGSGGDPGALATRLEQTVRHNRDEAYSRLLSPRLLQPNTGYHAFVIPSFETGRLAGLGKDPAGATFATQSAWAPGRPGPEVNDYPYYHRWYFRTGSAGDFEYLVRLLQPRTVDPRVGRRDMDVLDPGLYLPPIDHLGGILRLGGALLPPELSLSEAARQDIKKHDRWAAQPDPPNPPGPPHPFQTALAVIINLADDYGTEISAAANSAAATELPPDAKDKDELATSGDPLIVPPLYGRWHALMTRLDPAEATPPDPEDPADPAKKRWVQELNLDPRHRVAAGFGTEVVQKNQEDYMEAAWQQVGKVIEGNLKIRFAQIAKAVTAIWHGRELVSVQRATPERFLAIAAPIQRRILQDGVTVHHQVVESQLPVAAFSTTMRKALRPGGRAARLVGFDAGRNGGNLLERLNGGDVSAAPPKVIAPDLATGDSLADKLLPKGIPRFLIDFLLLHPWLRFVPLLVALLIVLLLLLVSPPVALVAGAVLIVLGILAFRLLDRLLKRLKAAEALRLEAATAESVDELPKSPDFKVGTPGVDPAPSSGSTDSAEAERFKEALGNVYAVDDAERSIPIKRRKPVGLGAIGAATIEGLRPERTIPARLFGSIQVPARIADQLANWPDRPGRAPADPPADPLGEVMVYPEIDVPMYQPLKNISSELFLPNIELIENNSITLLETNQKFIEAYMVGLNHEFARELLWREYWTDQRGSYFRQFWDVTTFLAEASVDPGALRERLRDIPELHTWRLDSELGEHDHREVQGRAEKELVLAIRGELLKKYPTAVIYAHRAEWERDTAGAIDKTEPRKLAGADGSEANPLPEFMKTPLYEAKVEPDITFFGFDLTAEDALGGPRDGQEDDPGWFFVIKERPGEPRFGLDTRAKNALTEVETWNELALIDVMPEPPGDNLRVGVRTVRVQAGEPSEDDVKPQWENDKDFTWRPDTHAAEVAYILYQLPVLMAVHAAEMLKPPGPPDA
jgi:hypothetical protein